MQALNTDVTFGLADPLPTSGVHSGFVRIPFSSNRSTYGFVPLPITVICGGEGPTLLLLGGTHGDEFHSQVALGQVARQLDPATMHGRVILLPMANAPASRAGTRNSPLDGQNLNRSFPGDILGSPTAVIADYIERCLMSASDFVLDLGSDGGSRRYLPSATLLYHPDADTRARRLAVALAFGAPTTLMFNAFEDRTTSGAAYRAGTVRVGTEIGGPDPIGATVRGIMRVLHWAGMVESGGAPPPRSALKVVRQNLDFVYALREGIFEPAHQLGTEVEAGDLAGHIHDIGRPLSVPAEIRFVQTGTLVCTRCDGPVIAGDFLVHLATACGPKLQAECDAATRLAWLPTQDAEGPGLRAAKSRRKKS